MVSALFIGMALLFSLLGHFHRRWPLSTVGVLLWFVVFFWWLLEGLDTLYGFTNTDLQEIVLYIPILLCFFTLADIINYWNTVEIRRSKGGNAWSEFGPRPKETESSYEKWMNKQRRGLK